MIVKTLSFACVHFSVAFSIAYIITGSVIVGGTLALVEPLCNTFAYYIHEHCWRIFRPAYLNKNKV